MVQRFSGPEKKTTNENRKESFMSLKVKMLLVVGSSLIVLAAVVYKQGWHGGEVEKVPVSPVQDLSKHPTYSKYSFGQADNVIDVGMQPLAFTISVISEAMKRDTVLKTALAKQDLELRFHPFFKGADANFFLLRGDLEAVIAGDMPTITAAAVSDVTIVAQNLLGFNSIVADRPKLIKDLRGKRIGYAFGSAAHFNILQALSSEGLEETDVNLIQLNVNEMPEALVQGKIDAFSAWEPTPTIALAEFDEFVAIHRCLVSTFLYFSRSFANQYPQAVRQVVASQLRSIQWLRNRKSNIQQACGWTAQSQRDFAGQKTMLSTEQCISLLKGDLLDIGNVSSIPKQDLEVGGRLFGEFKFLKEFGKIPGEVGWNKVKSSFDLTVIKDVLVVPKEFQINTYEYANDGW